jgi:hypothetical protein
MKKFDQFVKKFEKSSVEQPQNNKNKTPSRTPSKDNNNVSDNQKIKNEKKDKKETTPKKMKDMLDENLKLMNTLQGTNVLTRSASKNNKEENEEKKTGKFVPKRSQSLNPVKKEFLPKSSYLLNKNLKFKEKPESTKKTSVYPTNSTQNNTTSNPPDKTPSKGRQNSLKSEKKTRKEIKQEEIDNKFKNKYSFVKSKVKQFMKTQNEKMENKTNEDSNNPNYPNNTNSIKQDISEKKNIKRSHSVSVPKENYVRMNLKKGYQEKKLFRPKNIRKMKLDRGKAFYKLKNKMSHVSDDKYLGTGKEGLNFDLILDDEALQENQQHEDRSNDKILRERASEIKQMQNLQRENEGTGIILQQPPHFSEGYYNSIIEEIPTVITSINPDQNKKENDLSNIKVPRPGLTPTRMFTNKLTSALKSSLKKNIPLDTELRILSKEFRYLLSGKKKEAEEFIKKECEVKKLNFGNPGKYFNF